MTLYLHALFLIAVLAVNSAGQSALAASGTPLDQDPHVSTKNARVVRFDRCLFQFERRKRVDVSFDTGQTGSVHAWQARGLWEPHFEVSAAGALVMFWSDETDPCCSQKLAQIRSVDGVTWKDEKNTVACNIERDRPGIAWVTSTPAGIYFMTYELCGPAQCTVFSRTSRDGWNFGPPSNTGKNIETLAGEYFEHAPTNTSLSEAGSGDTILIVVGQMLYEKNGHVSPKNGQVLFVNRSIDGSGAWKTIPAPVKVPDARNHPCPNYSSVLLPVRGGSALLEMASDFNGFRTCVTYYATESLR
jgi:hypothetical protein